MFETIDRLQRTSVALCRIVKMITSNEIFDKRIVMQLELGQTCIQGISTSVTQTAIST